MSWFISIIASLLAGIASLFLAGFIANACVAWHHVSSREGAAGYFVVFTALAGGIAGTIIGLITARLIATHFGTGFAKELCGALGLVLVIAGVAALLCHLLADVTPKIARSCWASRPSHRSASVRPYRTKCLSRFLSSSTLPAEPPTQFPCGVKRPLQKRSAEHCSA